MDPYSAAEWPDRATRLTDRDGQRGVLDRLVDAVRAGESRVLVVRGDPGVGKTVLLNYLAERAGGCRIARATGVQSEMELAFAGLHQLCAPMLDHLDRIPVPQREALRTALGLAAGPPPNRFLIGLAVLSLLSEVAGDQPLICLIDDEQWLDQATELMLGFVARRLAADPVALVFATRDPGAELAGQPELVVAGLKDDHARALLDSALAGPLDARVRDLIIAATRGNPPGAAGTAARADPGRAGRQVRPACRLSADRPDRGRPPHTRGTWAFRSGPWWNWSRPPCTAG